jgi:hypothetical protein
MDQRAGRYKGAGHFKEETLISGKRQKAARKADQTA